MGAGSRRHRIFVIVLVGVLFGGLPLVPTPVPLDESALAQESPPEASPELERLQTPTAITTRAGGIYRTELFSEPVQYEQSNGQWAPISSRLVETQEDGFDLTNEANSFDVLFDQSSATDYLQVEVGNKEFSLDLAGNAAVAADVAGTKITYPDTIENTDLTYRVTSEGVKETLVLEDAEAPTSYRFYMSAPAQGDFEAFEQEDESWHFYAKNAHEPTFTLEAPFVTDSAGASGSAEDNPASMEVAEVDGQFVIDLALDEAWLTDDERVFPVMLDPTLTVIQEPEDETADASYPWDCATCSPNNGPRLLIGGDGTRARWRAALRFDLAAIPENAHISKAELKIRYDGNCLIACSNAHTIEARRILDGWSETDSKPGSFGHSSSNLDQFFLPSNASIQWMDWDLTAVTRDWLLGNLANHGVLLKRSTESLNSSGPKPPSSTDAETWRRPKLEVTWSDTGVNLFPVSTTHSTGAELEWTEASPNVGNFQSYVVHRSATQNFTPSAATQLVEIADREVTSFTDSTAKPSSTFYYKVGLTGYGNSNERAVTTPAAGTAVAVLQPGPDEGVATALESSSVTCEDGGAKKWLRVGTDSQQTYRAFLRFDFSGIPTTANIQLAELSLYHKPEGTAATPTVVVSQVKTGWTEGTGEVEGECTDNGATWLQAQPGAEWTGGDITSEDQVATQLVWPRSHAGWDTFRGLESLVQGWVSGEQPNHGVALSLQNETLADDNSFVYYGDDYTYSSALRPKLVLMYQDGSQPVAPQTSVGRPTADETLTGSASNPVTLVAAASDDGRVTKVEFLVDGNVVATSNAANVEGAFTAQWNPASVSNGSHTMTTKAYDEVGQTATSNAVNFMVDNSQVTTSLNSPGSGPLQGTVQLEATASSGVGIQRVDFLVDGVAVGTDASAPYTTSWNTLDPETIAYNGNHVLSTRAFAVSGLSAESQSVNVTVDNSQSSQNEMYDGSIELATTSAPIPDDVLKNPDLELDNLDSTYTQYAPYSLSADPHDATAPVSEGGRATVSNPEEPESFPVTLRVTNSSGVTWDNEAVRLWYRWINLNDQVVYEAPAPTFTEDVATGTTKSVDVTVNPPSLPSGTELADYALRFDLHDSLGPNGEDPGGQWFSAAGMAPAQNSVQVNRALDNALGLERYWHYDAEPVGAGMTHLTNVANGNSILRWTPMSSPGRGLATVVDLTYNSLNADGQPPPAGPANNGPAWSPVGANFSLSISSLTALGKPLDFDPAAPSTNAGNRKVTLTDGDGTMHTFNGPQITGSNKWQEPPGVNLYLRKVSISPDKTWAITRPDRVTFYFDAMGWPTSVEDRNGNSLTFVDVETGGSSDPGRPRMRITQVIDDAGRSYNLEYYDGSEGECSSSSQVQGNVEWITDHEGRKLIFRYYQHGELRQLIQKGGTNDDGSRQLDRNFTFIYTNTAGTDAATTTAACGIDQQSARIYSVQDPRGNKTIFDYITPDGNQTKWRLESRTNREDDQTSYAYDLSSKLTTVNMPEDRRSIFKYDADGKVLEIRRKAPNSRTETTKLNWSTDFAVTRLTEPTGRFETFNYNPNGYLTQHSDQRLDDKDPSTAPDPTKTKVTRLTYNNRSADGADTGLHISDLATISPPEHETAGQWKFFYDASFNIDYVLDPEGHKTEYTYAGSTGHGLLQEVIDANNHKTTYGAYDGNGLPGTVTVDPTGANLVTKFDFDEDGLMKWVQDPNLTSNNVVGETVEDRTTFLYDRFRRLIGQSTPKSADFEPGTLILTATSYDNNDNAVKTISPSYTGDEVGAATTYTYDKMDRPLTTTGPEAGVTTKMMYDAAGRLASVTLPNGVGTASVHDYVTNYDYDVLDRVIKETRYDNPEGQERPLPTHYCYQNDSGDLVWVTPPRGSTQFATSGCGTAPSPASRPTDFSTGYEYLEDHMLKTVTDPKGHTRSVVYDENGNIKSATDSQQGTTTYTYDKRDLLTQVVEPFTDSRGVTTRYEYDPVGNVTRVISPRAVDNGYTPGTGFKPFVTDYVYDGANRLVETILPRAQSTDEIVHLHNVYDGTHLATTTLPTTATTAAGVPSDGKTTMTHWDPGWIRTSNDGVNPEILFDYTAQGWQASRKVVYGKTQFDAKRIRKTTWEYYRDGMLKERKAKGDDPVRYFYDENNNLIEAQVANRIRTKSEKPMKVLAEYDWLNRPTKVRHRKGLGGSGAFTYSTFAYDPNGNLERRVVDAVEGDSAGRMQEFTYNEADWLTKQENLGEPSACGDDYLITNQFTDNGWEDIRTIKKGCTPTLVEEMNWDYFANGKLKKLTNSGDAGVLEVREVSYLDGSGAYVNGHRTEEKFGLTVPEKVSQCEPSSGNPTCTAKFVYDARDRLVEHHDGHGGQTTYKFDEPAYVTPDSLRASNLTTEAKTSNGTTTTTHRYYKGTQLSKITQGTSESYYLYDPFGNLDCIVSNATSNRKVCRQKASGWDGALLANYNYDPFDRLKEYARFNGSGSKTKRATFTYDALDRVVAQTGRHTSGGATKTTTFSYQGLSGLVSSEDGTDSDKSYSYDAYGLRLSMSNTEAGETKNYAYGYDVHGSVSLLIGAGGPTNGQAEASYGYDPYGGTDSELTEGDDSTTNPTNPYRYTGKRVDSVSGSLDMGARRFGPDIRSFLQRDVLDSALSDLGLATDPLTQNRYSLAGGNPVTFIETDGHKFHDYDTGTATKVAQETERKRAQSRSYLDAVAETVSTADMGTTSVSTAEPESPSLLETAGQGLSDWVSGTVEGVKTSIMFTGSVATANFDDAYDIAEAQVKNTILSIPENAKRGLLLGPYTAVSYATYRIQKDGMDAYAQEAVYGVTNTAPDAALIAFGGVGGVRAASTSASRTATSLARSTTTGISRGGQYLFENWHRGTFPNRLQSIQYHLGKHGAGRTAVQYTEDAMRFFDEYSQLGKPVTLMDGTAGTRIQTKLPDPAGGFHTVGGYWTETGKLVTFWD